MSRLAIVAVVLTSLWYTLVGAEEPPKKPPYQRMLKDEDEKKAAQWQKRIAALEKAGKRAEALKLALEVLALRRRVQGADHWQVKDAGRAVADLRRDFTPQQRRDLAEAESLNAEFLKVYGEGKYPQAAPLARKALALRRQALGDEHPDTAVSLNNLAALYEALGRHVEAEAHYKAGLQICRQALGDEHPSTATSLNNLASLYARHGRYGEAEPLHQDALRIRRKALGELHPHTAGSLNNLAGLHFRQGKYSEAEPLFKNALGICRKALGEDHPSTATSLNNLALLYSRQGRYAEAESLYKDALRIRRKALGEDHPSTGTSLNNLALLYSRQGRYGEAEPLYKDALRITRKARGEGHPHTAASLNNLAVLYERQGRYGEAEPLYQEALRIRRKALGEEHPDTAQSLNNLALLHKSQGRYGEAEPLYQEALRITREALGDDHPDTAASLNNLATLYESQGRYGEAEPLHKEALRIRRKALGEEHPSTAQSLNNLALLYASQGRYAEAEPLFKDAVRIRRLALGERHPDTAGSLNGLALLYESRGRYGDAEPLHKEALGICREALGEQHPDTALTVNNRAVCLWRLGRREQAIGLLRRSLPGQEAARFSSASTGFGRALASRPFSPHAALAVGLARGDDPQQAFAHAERSFARGLLDDLSDDPPEEVQHRTAVAGRLAALDKRLLPLLGGTELSEDQKGLRDRLTAQRRDLARELAELAGKSSARRVLPTADIQKQIPKDAALVCWVDLLGEHLGCVLRRAGPPRWVRLPGTGEGGEWTDADRYRPTQAYHALRGPFLSGDERKQLLAATTEKTRELARQALDPGQRGKILKAAHAQRIAPLLPHLGGVKRLIVVPTGEMAALPVEALTADYEVSYAPSGTAFARTMQRHRPLKAEGLLVVADPNYRPTPVKLPPPPPHGVFVKAVLPKGLASRIGLEPGDVLLEYAGTKLTQPKDLAYAKEGERVAVKLWREGKSLAGPIPGGELGVALDARPVAVALKAWRDGDPLRVAASRGEQWGQLPGTRLEARLLQGLLPSAKLLLGSDASQQSLMALAASGELKKYRLLHFATHGQAVPQVPRRSALILAQDRLPSPKEQRERVLAGKPPIDGRLDVGTILDRWELDADLVVLSACQTGLGRQTAGEGMLGFSQALLQRGARSVVLSRWKVGDTATALLMGRFYENLLGKRAALKGPLRRAEALAEAKVWLRTLPREQALARADALHKEWVSRGLKGTKPLPVPAGGKGGPAARERPFAHPYHWAAFILLGDPL